MLARRQDSILLMRLRPTSTYLPPCYNLCFSEPIFLFSLISYLFPPLFRAESIVDQISDIGNLLSGIAFNRELDEAGKAAAIEKARKGTLPKMFAGLVTYQGDKDFFFAKESIADFALYGLIEGMKAFMPIVEIVQEIAPSLFKIVDSVNKLPQLADYYVKRDNVEAAEAAAKGSN